MNQAGLFRRISSIMEVADISYMLTGSFAGAVYGLGRSSLDIDLVVTADDRQILHMMQLLYEHAFYSETQAAIEAYRENSMFHLIDNVTALKIDFIFQKKRAFSKEEFGRRRRAIVEGAPFYIVAPEDLIIASLEWFSLGASSRQIEDVASILKVRKDELDFAYIERWIRELGLNSQWRAARKLAGLE